MSNDAGFATAAFVCALLCVNPAIGVIGGETPPTTERRFDACCALSYTAWFSGQPFWNNHFGSGTLIAPDLVLVARHALPWEGIAWTSPQFVPPPAYHMTVRFRRRHDGTVGLVDVADPDGDEGASSFFHVPVVEWFLAPWPGPPYSNPPDVAIGRLAECVTHIDPIPVRFALATDFPAATPIRLTGWGKEGCGPMGGCTGECLESHRLKQAPNGVLPHLFPNLFWHDPCDEVFFNGSALFDSGAGILLENATCGSLEVIAVVRDVTNGTVLGPLEGFPSFPISTYVNQCPADLNNDQSVSGVDLAELLANWGGTIHGDLNCDGVVNGLDLAALLAAWGPCPSICPSGPSAPLGSGEGAASSSTGVDPFLVWAQQATIEELLYWLETGCWPGEVIAE